MRQRSVGALGLGLIASGLVGGGIACDLQLLEGGGRRNYVHKLHYMNFCSDRQVRVFKPMNKSMLTNGNE